MKKEESAAILTIKAASKMTPEGRKEIAAWLRHQAAMLVKDGKNYSDTKFTARYLCG